MKEVTQKLNQLDHQYIWHPFTSMREWVRNESIIIEKGEGVWLTDTEGRSYIDGVSSIWANIHGHNKAELNEAIKNQMDKVAHSTLLGLGNIPSIELAEALVKLAPEGLSKVFYSDNGSTAIEVGLKIAYQYWQQEGKKKKKKLITLKQSYHGDTMGGVSLGGIDRYRRIFSDLVFEVIEVENPYYYRSGFRSEEECRDDCLKKLREELARNEGEVGALFLESYIQGAGGMIVYPLGYMKGVEELCREYEVLLILDEVATGFGRTCRMFACEEDWIRPDIMALGKGISGGYVPLAATLTTERIYESFLGNEEGREKTFFHGHTYSGNPIGCCVGLASLDLFEKEDLLGKARENEGWMREGLKKYWGLKHVGDIRQKGMMVGVELVKDRRTKEKYAKAAGIGKKVTVAARGHEILIRPLGDIIVIMPPLSIEEEEVKKLLGGIYAAIWEVTEES